MPEFSSRGHEAASRRHGNVVIISHMNAGRFQSVELHDLGALRIAGADAVRFLQGQLSNDLARVS
ncbi:MAG TPA: hypothetical protein VMD06_11255, partial [Steroidobacteraceae bacterium]|nr:hypothetical protein [Steroidobacteraceae bacterium]